MSNQRLPDIDAILDHIYQHDTAEPHDESQSRRTINIYIDAQEEVADRPPTIESTLDEQPATTTTNETDASIHTEQPAQSHVTELSSTKRQRRTNSVLLLFLILSSIGIMTRIGYAVLMPLLTPSASVTIVIVSRQLTTTSTLQLVTNGPADLMKNQLPGRALPAITMS